MSTGNINLDLLLRKIQHDALTGTRDSVAAIRKRYPALTESEALEIYSLVAGAVNDSAGEKSSLVVTAPASFSIRAKSTKNTVENLIKGARSSILITGYSLSDYFGELVDVIVHKSQSGVFVKFFVNDIESQSGFDKIIRYKGRFLKVYNYPRQKDDRMSALHAKVLSVDGSKTLITSANLSFHGQEGNLELGTLMESSEITRQVDDVFTRLIFKKVFVEV